MLQPKRMRSITYMRWQPLLIKLTALPIRECHEVRAMKNFIPRLACALLFSGLAVAASTAQRELDGALRATPDAFNGEALFDHCASCHGADGGGEADGSTPRIAGQHFRVLAKQLVDFRSGKRWDFRMEGAADAAPSHRLTGHRRRRRLRGKLDRAGNARYRQRRIRRGRKPHLREAVCVVPRTCGRGECTTRRAAPRGPALWIPHAADVRRRRWPAAGAAAPAFAAHRATRLRAGARGFRLPGAHRLAAGRRASSDSLTTEPARESVEAHAMRARSPRPRRAPRR